MQILIWLGVVLASLGLAGILFSIVRIAGAKRAGLDDVALRTALKSAMIFNLGGLFMAAIGLMMAVVAVILR